MIRQIINKYCKQSSTSLLLAENHVAFRWFLSKNWTNDDRYAKTALIRLQSQAKMTIKLNRFVFPKKT